MTEKKSVFMFLDDDAFHPDKIRHPRYYYPLIGADDLLEKVYNSELVVNTTVEGAIDYIERNNDLMRELEGVDLAKWLVEKDMDDPSFLPKDFNFFVHSQNPIAKEKIYSYLGQYLEFKDRSNEDAPKPKRPSI